MGPTPRCREAFISMKIAILIPGHLRAWHMCKENFMHTLYDIENYEIDVFVDTYHQVFRTTAASRNEKDVVIVKSEDQIREMFDGINVVNYKIQNEDTTPDVSDVENHQLTRIRSISKDFEKYCIENNKEYDLVVRTRFDIIINNKINYDVIYDACMRDNNLVFIGNGVNHNGPNDMISIGLMHANKIILERENIYMHCVAGRLSFDSSIWHKIVRYNENMELVPEQHFG